MKLVHYSHLHISRFTCLFSLSGERLPFLLEEIFCHFNAAKMFASMFLHYVYRPCSLKITSITKSRRIFMTFRESLRCGKQRKYAWFKFFFSNSWFSCLLKISECISMFAARNSIWIVMKTNEIHRTKCIQYLISEQTNWDSIARSSG